MLILRIRKFFRNLWMCLIIRRKNMETNLQLKKLTLCQHLLHPSPKKCPRLPSKFHLLKFHHHSYSLNHKPNRSHCNNNLKWACPSFLLKMTSSKQSKILTQQDKRKTTIWFPRNSQWTTFLHHNLHPPKSKTRSTCYWWVPASQQPQASRASPQSQVSTVSP